MSSACAILEEPADYGIPQQHLLLNYQLHGPELHMREASSLGKMHCIACIHVVSRSVVDGAVQ